eukprot:CAMPEP_0196791490 /NCGR_PEP_ID=MMETSP1104-20130614/29947_1 /TAXON_ID=33652 /ORGANISM="Cafeteria sp., Strain Caron Lab Isolate" /LENGTH=31 /DNA_ID= /DNA_START= /DNA_END= /DNA_ORIENTATION=
MPPATMSAGIGAEACVAPAAPSDAVPVPAAV